LSEQAETRRAKPIVCCPRDEFSTFTWLLEPMLERADLAIVEARSFDRIRQASSSGQ
jgi:hypothetical protein